MDSLRQEAVAELARRCVIQGKADGSFGYADPLQRCDGAVLLMRYWSRWTIAAAARARPSPFTF